MMLAGQTLGLVQHWPPTYIQYLCCARYSTVQKLSDK